MNVQIVALCRERNRKMKPCESFGPVLSLNFNVTMMGLVSSFHRPDEQTDIACRPKKRLAGLKTVDPTQR